MLQAIVQFSLRFRGIVLSLAHKRASLGEAGKWVLAEQADANVARSITTDHVVTDQFDRFTIDNVRVDCPSNSFCE